MSNEPSEIYSPGLEGVIAGETAISTVSGGLRYRGYPVTELAEQCSFEEVAYLLLHGELPNKPRLAEFQKRVAGQSLPPLLSDLLRSLPKNAVPMDVSLILYAEHEFNASTFAARVICSTEADLHAAIVGAIGALKGRLHGGANEKVMDMLLQTGGPSTAEAWIRSALARKDKVMGFG